MKFPREVGLPKRRIVRDLKEYLEIINSYNGKSKSIFTTVYDANFIGDVPNYNCIFLDRLFFDFDENDCWSECNKLHMFLKSENIKHKINLSGRGYHLFIFTMPYKANNTKNCILGAQKYFVDKLNLNCDKQILGDSSRLRRVENTFNTKAGKFCIPLTEQEFEKGDSFVRDLAKQQHFIKNTEVGEKLYDISSYDIEGENFSLPEVETQSTNEVNITDIPLCIKNLMIPSARWADRYLIIIFFREKGYSLQETYEVLKSFLSPRKLFHCIKEERQLQYLYSRPEIFFPSCDDMRSKGKCNGSCQYEGGQGIYII